jgi:hypothetical protein
MTARTVRHRRFGPRVVAIARFVAVEIGCDLIPLLHEADRRWLDPSVRDLIGAMALAQRSP